MLFEGLDVLNVQVCVEGLVTQPLVALLPPGELLAALVAGGLVGCALLGGEVLPQCFPLGLTTGKKLTF